MCFAKSCTEAYQPLAKGFGVDASGPIPLDRYEIQLGAEGMFESASHRF